MQLFCRLFKFTQKMPAIAIAQFVLNEGRREIRRRVLPTASLQGQNLKSGVGQLLTNDRAGLSEANKHYVG